MNQDEKAALQNEGCFSVAFTLTYTDAKGSIERLMAGEGVESTSVPICVGWPPAERKEHEREWPRFGGPHPIGHDSLDGR